MKIHSNDYLPASYSTSFNYYKLFLNKSIYLKNFWFLVSQSFFLDIILSKQMAQFLLVSDYNVLSISNILLLIVSKSYLVYSNSFLANIFSFSLYCSNTNSCYFINKSYSSKVYYYISVYVFNSEFYTNNDLIIFLQAININN